MRLRCLIFFLLSIVLSTFAQAGDTLDIQRKIVHSFSPVQRFRRQVYVNPALNYHLQDFSLSSLSVNADWEDRGRAFLAEEGDGGKTMGVQTESFLRFSDKVRVFGRAGYHKEHRGNVLWNETSDYGVIAPYVTADSIGGSMDGEEYSFMGGYAREIGKWTVGASLDYRAAIYYRQKDPRPKNVISDINATFGVGRALSDTHYLGFSLFLRKYNQDSNISFYSDLGSTSVYQMLGLGMDYVRFAGNQFSSTYKGKGVGVGFDLLPRAQNGLSASFQVNHFGLEKLLSSINYAPIVKMNKNTASFELAWLTSYKKFLLGARLEALGRLNSGKENIFGDPSGGSYPIISRLKQYTDKQMDLTLTGILSSNSDKRNRTWSILPFVGFSWEKTAYKIPERSMEWTTLRLGMKSNASFPVKGGLLQADLSLGYDSNLSADYLLNGLNLQSAVGMTVFQNYTYLKDSFAHLGLSCRYDHLLVGNKTLFASLSWKHAAYKESGTLNHLQAGIGLTF